MEGKAFITGAFGFLGAYLARELSSSDWEVSGIGHGGSVAAAKRLGLKNWSEESVSVRALLGLAKKAGIPDVVFHCAGSGSVVNSITNPHADFIANVVSTEQTLEFCRLCSSHPALVFTSSAAVYGVAGDLPISENAPLKPVSPYGVHKLIAEDLCRSYGKSWEIPVLVVRLFSVYGPGLRKQLLWDACEKARKDAFTFFGTGAETRDWLHARDAARLLREASRLASPECPPLNGGTGVGILVRELVELIGELWNPERVPLFSGLMRGGDPLNYRAHCGKLSQMGFVPAIPFADGVREYVEWYQKLLENG